MTGVLENAPNNGLLSVSNNDCLPSLGGRLSTNNDSILMAAGRFLLRAIIGWRSPAPARRNAKSTAGHRKLLTLKLNCTLAHLYRFAIRILPQVAVTSTNRPLFDRTGFNLYLITRLFTRKLLTTEHLLRGRA